MKIDKNNASIIFSGVPEEGDGTTKKTAISSDEAYRRLKAILVNPEEGVAPKKHKIKKARKPKIQKKKDNDGIVLGTYTGHLKADGPILVAQADIAGTIAKPYPGPNSFLGLRALAWSSTVVMAIVNYRRNQLVKKDISIVPKNSKEPPFRMSLLDYPVNEVMYLPYLKDEDKKGLVEIFRKLDPLGVHPQKGLLFKEAKEDGTLSEYEISLVKYYENKHWEFHMKRSKDIRGLLKFLNDPDPYYSEKSSWKYLLSVVLEDLLLLDRGAVIKTRDEDGKIIALTAVDGATIRPVISESGYIEKYAQVVDGHEFVAVYDKEDVIIFSMNNTSDVYRYGYGWPNMEILYRTVASDIFIDKGNLDYYRKGGSIPEGIIVAEPPGNSDEHYVALSKEQLDAIQRQIQSIMMSDYTQVPIVTGAKISFIDFKGKRKDMQFKELAEYLTRKICAVFQVSPQDVGVLADVNRSTAEVQMSLTKSKGLETLASAISEEFTRGFIDEFRKEKDLKLWWVEDDLKNERDAWTVINGQLTAGVLTINEVRHRYGESPVPWGDVPFIGGKNWRSEEEAIWEQKEQQQQMLGGIGGIPGAMGGAAPPPAPGMDSQAPIIPGPDGKITSPNPGQIKGQSLGTPPKMKSIGSPDLDIPIVEEDPDLNVDELLTSIVFSEDQIKEETGQEAPINLLDTMDEFVKANIKNVYLTESDLVLVVEPQNLDITRATQLLEQLVSISEVIDVQTIKKKEGMLDYIKMVVVYEPFSLSAFKDPYLQALATLFWLPNGNDFDVISPVRRSVQIIVTDKPISEETKKAGEIIEAGKTPKETLKNAIEAMGVGKLMVNYMFDIGSGSSALFTSMLNSGNEDAFKYFFETINEYVDSLLSEKKEDVLYQSLVTAFAKLTSVFREFTENDDKYSKAFELVLSAYEKVVKYFAVMSFGVPKRRANSFAKLVRDESTETQFIFREAVFEELVTFVEGDAPYVRAMLASKEEETRLKSVSVLLSTAQAPISHKDEFGDVVSYTLSMLDNLIKPLSKLSGVDEKKVSEEVERQKAFIENTCSQLQRIFEVFESKFDVDESIKSSIRVSVCLMNMYSDFVFIDYDKAEGEFAGYLRALRSQIFDMKLKRGYLSAAVLEESDPVLEYYKVINLYLGMFAAYIGAAEVALDEFRSVLSAELGIDIDMIKLPENVEPYETFTELLGQLSVGELQLVDSPALLPAVKSLLSPGELTPVDKAVLKSLVN